MTLKKLLDLFQVKIEVLVAGSTEKLVSLLENRENGRHSEFFPRLRNQATNSRFSKYFHDLEKATRSLLSHNRRA